MLRNVGSFRFSEGKSFKSKSKPLKSPARRRFRILIIATNIPTLWYQFRESIRTSVMIKCPFIWPYSVSIKITIDLSTYPKNIISSVIPIYIISNLYIYNIYNVRIYTLFFPFLLWSESDILIKTAANFYVLSYAFVHYISNSKSHWQKPYKFHWVTGCFQTKSTLKWTPKLK